MMCEQLGKRFTRNGNWQPNAGGEKKWRRVNVKEAGISRVDIQRFRGRETEPEKVVVC